MDKRLWIQFFRISSVLLIVLAIVNTCQSSWFSRFNEIRVHSAGYYPYLSLKLPFALPSGYLSLLAGPMYVLAAILVFGHYTKKKEEIKGLYEKNSFEEKEAESRLSDGYIMIPFFIGLIFGGIVVSAVPVNIYLLLGLWFFTACIVAVLAMIPLSSRRLPKDMTVSPLYLSLGTFLGIGIGATAATCIFCAWPIAFSLMQGMLIAIVAEFAFLVLLGVVIPALKNIIPKICTFFVADDAY